MGNKFFSRKERRALKMTKMTKRNVIYSHAFITKHYLAAVCGQSNFGVGF